MSVWPESVDPGTREVDGKQSQKPKRAVHPDSQKGGARDRLRSILGVQASQCLGPLRNSPIFCSWPENAKCDSQTGTKIRQTLCKAPLNNYKRTRVLRKKGASKPPTEGHSPNRWWEGDDLFL